jgi:membrane-bound inhibitor of C-type lysozyme
MNARPIASRVFWAAVALALVAWPALAQAPEAQPPMNDFNQAFYRCEGGGAFMMSYDSDQPTSAEMATNGEVQHHKLKRAPSASGVQFSGGGVKFWTDGKSTIVEGTKSPFKNCKTKVG